MNKPEILDLVDADDNVIDTLSRDEIYTKNLYEQYCVRVIEVFIKNSKGQLWIPTRINTKRIAPGGYDIGVGGHVEHGETYLEAFKKEVYEEVGWNINDIVYKEIGKFSPKDGMYQTISAVYEIESEVAPEINSDDFSLAAWMYPQEVVDSIVAGHEAKMNLLPLLKLVYSVK